MNPTVAGSRRIFQATVILVVAMACWSSLAHADKLTIDESIKLALENNPKMRIARETLRKAGALIDEATAQGMPKLSLDGTWQRLDEVPLAKLGDRQIPLGNLDNRTANLALVQPLDVFGVVRTGKKVAKHNMSAATSEYQQTTNDLVLEVKTAYFNVLRAQRYLKVQEDTIKALEAHLADAKARLQAGTAARFEVMRAETQVANARQQLIAAQNGVELARSAFNNVLGRPLDTPFELDEPEQPRYVDVDASRCITKACENRPEVLRVEAQVRAAIEQAKAAALLGKPRFNLRWVYNKNFDTTLFNPRDKSWQAFLTTSISLYDGGSTKASVEKARADAESMKSLRDQTRLGVTLDAQQSYLSLRESRERIQAAEKALEQARESMRLAQVRYQGGVSTQVELFDAQSALTLAETNYVNAIYDYQVSLAKVEHAVGGPDAMAKLLDESTGLQQASNQEMAKLQR